MDIQEFGNRTYYGQRLVRFCQRRLGRPAVAVFGLGERHLKSQEFESCTGCPGTVLLAGGIQEDISNYINHKTSPAYTAWPILPKTPTFIT